MSPQDWPVPSVDVARQCLGMQYWEGVLPDELMPIGSIIADMGCDRKCDFCQTPTYQIGYNRMTPARFGEWLDVQKQAGARSFICPSDQFLARILWKEEGRREILEIMDMVRASGLPILWGNGLEIRKATIGRGLPKGDLRPDEELVNALWGWDGKVGCYQAYIPAERPMAGREDYRKLLPWLEHCEMMRTIVRAGIPEITYGVIVGFADDNDETLGNLADAVTRLYHDLKSLNPDLSFRVTPYAIRPLPGTPQGISLRSSGLLRFHDPAVIGGFWTACADTEFIGYEEVAKWQSRLFAIGDQEERWQGITAVEAS